MVSFGVRELFFLVQKASGGDACPSWGIVNSFPQAVMLVRFPSL
jgi:hypothetical protein